MPTNIKASCVCGAIQINIKIIPLVKAICYCLDCRKNSGHLGQFLAKFSPDQLEINDEKSVLKEYTVVKTQSGFPKKKLFCGDCGCTIATKPMKYDGQVIFLRSSLIDDGNDFIKLAPTKVLFAEEKREYTCENECVYF